MSIFKCKMCGGTLEINANQTTATCEYCGTQQTLPKLDDDRRANLYDRANHFRRNNEFDKAMSIYENILDEDSSDAEAYWSLVLCQYGIEYVEDPASHKRIPTVNRAQFTSIFDDDNYKSALQYADGYQKAIYEQEAAAINEIQKGILAISQEEEPFDVFICYKETDNNGRRTQDSVLANDLYHQLTAEGFKVFFSQITLEDKLGVAYEPYIFAALNSAKVMVVLGTKPEYFNAVWVKNEWSRYLALVKQSAGKKVLIPAYRDMDPYDLPEEFSHLQAQDMSKLGFMQDLIRGINKLVQNNTPKTTAKETVIVNGGNANTAPLLKRAFMFLEDGEWTSADEYCEKVLDQDPENALAYLGKLMAELHICKQDALRDHADPFDDRNNYKKALRFADDKLKSTLSGYIEHINNRNENARLEGIYNHANGKMASAKTESAYKEAASLFERIREYRDSATLANECYEKAEWARKDGVLSDAKSKMTGAVISNYESAIKLFESISGWKDADEQIHNCKQKIEELKARAEIARVEAEKYAKRNKKITIIITPIACAVIVFIIVLTPIIIPHVKYNDAVALMNAGKIIEAYESLIALEGYKDSAEKASAIFDEYKIEKRKLAEIGDYVLFGAYEQDNNTSNGKEDIEWLVLDKKDGKVLVISKYALEMQAYHDDDYAKTPNITWETCSLREWLNDSFLNAAFSDAEKAMIPTVTVSADKNPDYSTKPGNATQDKVFLLSATEVNKYFSSDSARQCKATAYAETQGTYLEMVNMYDEYGKSFNGKCWWWLRSPGDNEYGAECVNDDGGVSGHPADGFGNIVGNYYIYIGVRPALWIDLNS